MVTNRQRRKLSLSFLPKVHTVHDSTVVLEHRATITTTKKSRYGGGYVFVYVSEFWDGRVHQLQLPEPPRIFRTPQQCARDAHQTPRQCVPFLIQPARARVTIFSNPTPYQLTFKRGSTSKRSLSTSCPTPASVSMPPTTSSLSTTAHHRANRSSPPRVVFLSP